MNKYSEQKTNEQIEKIITSMKEQQAKNENWAPCWVKTNTGRPINFTTNDFYTGSNTFFCNSILSSFTISSISANFKNS